MRFEQTLTFGGIICFWLILTLLASWVLFRTHQAIDMVMNLAKKLPFYNPAHYPDPHSENVVFFYRLGALAFILLPIVPLIIIVQNCVLQQNCNTP